MLVFQVGKPVFLLNVFSESPFFSRGPSINTVVSLPRISHQDVWESESRMLQVIPDNVGREKFVVCLVVEIRLNKKTG